MLALDADAPKPPAYPFIIYSFKEPPADEQNKAHQFPGDLRQPHLQIFQLQPYASAPRRRRHRCLRFGKALFRPTHKIPQEEISDNVAFSS